MKKIIEQKELEPRRVLARLERELKKISQTRGLDSWALGVPSVRPKSDDDLLCALAAIARIMRKIDLIKANPSRNAEMGISEDALIEYIERNVENVSADGRESFLYLLSEEAARLEAERLATEAKDAVKAETEAAEAAAKKVAKAKIEAAEAAKTWEDATVAAAAPTSEPAPVRAPEPVLAPAPAQAQAPAPPPPRTPQEEQAAAEAAAKAEKVAKAAEAKMLAEQYLAKAEEEAKKAAADAKDAEESVTKNLMARDEEYMAAYTPMMDAGERKSLERFMPYLEGNPRRLKRIVNVYNVSRRIAELRNGKNWSELPAFKPKLLKFAILLEQWPYRMAWLLQFIEDTMQSDALHKACKKQLIPEHAAKIAETGTFLPQLLEKEFSLQFETPEGMQEEMLKLNAILVYKKVVQGLLYAPTNCEIRSYLDLDADPQDFEALLLEEPIFTVRDLCTDQELQLGTSSEASEQLVPSDKLGGRPSDKLLRNYAFNLSQGIIKHVSGFFDELVLRPSEQVAEGDPDDPSKERQVGFAHKQSFLHKPGKGASITLQK